MSGRGSFHSSSPDMERLQRVFIEKCLSNPNAIECHNVISALPKPFKSFGFLLADDKSLYNARVLCACGIMTSTTGVPEVCRRNAAIISKGLAKKLLKVFLADPSLIEHIANKMVRSRINPVHYRKSKGIVVNAVRTAIELYGIKAVLNMLYRINTELYWNRRFGAGLICERCPSRGGICERAFNAVLLYMLASGLSELIRECSERKCPKEVAGFMDAIVKQYARKRFREATLKGRKELTREEYAVYQMSPTLKSLLSKKALLVLINECERELSDSLPLDENEKAQTVMKCVAEKLVSPRKVKNPYLRIELMAVKRDIRGRAAQEVELALKSLLSG